MCACARAALSAASPSPRSRRWQQVSPSESLIQRDVARTFPEHTFFADKEGSGRDALFNVLKAYALYDAELGYCQGMAFVAGLLLLHMPEEHAFSMLVRLLEDFGLRSMYLPGMDGLSLRFTCVIAANRV